MKLTKVKSWYGSCSITKLQVGVGPHVTQTTLNTPPLCCCVAPQAPQDWRMELDGLPPGEYGQQQQRQQHGAQRGRGGRGGQQRQRYPEPEPGKPVEGCWFCLSSDQVGCVHVP